MALTRSQRKDGPVTAHLKQPVVRYVAACFAILAVWKGTTAAQGMLAADAMTVDGSAEWRHGCEYFNAAPPRYVAFTQWPGGWNNRRMALEAVVVLAALGGRTVVLPPRKDTVYHDDQHGGAPLQWDEAFDMEAMRRVYRVVWYEEFAVCGGFRKLPPPRALAGCASEDFSDAHRGYASWECARALAERYCEQKYPLVGPWRTGCTAMAPLIHRAEVMPSMEQSRSKYFAIPSDADGAFHQPGQVKTRFYETDPAVQAAPLLFFSEILTFASTSVWVAPDAPSDQALAPGVPSPFPGGVSMREAVWGAWRDGVVYHPAITALADKVIAQHLGGVEKFSCMHLRLGDFVEGRGARGITRAGAIGRFEDLFHDGETVFLMTNDEGVVKREMPAVTKFQAVFWGDLPITLAPLRRELEALVNQEVCVRARVFIGNHVSTVTQYIVKRRGFAGRPTYFSTVPEPFAHQPGGLPDAVAPWSGEDPQAWTW
eukprot:TRINITY_DN30561_c0_g1_i1.p1 TRINITY_DN30561_c0_g1~~TRINITY_DN30561_c0_g1_i1.p1  ORF type:complete len:485 (+),score=114.26 TRINITY_DN30561_c0_g1_i1:71-1525(+)